MSDLDTILAQIEEEPWNADDIIAPLDKKTRAQLHEKLLDLCRKKPTASMVKALGEFPGDATLDTLLVLVRKKPKGGVLERIPGVLEKVGGKRAIEALRKLVTFPKPSVARLAIEGLPQSREHTRLVLEHFDACAESGDDLLLLAAVEHLTPSLEKNDEVVEAFARHWDFGIRTTNTLMASNAIFDALIAEVPQHPVARAAFEAAAKHEHEYGQVRGLAALALTGIDTRENRKTLVALKLKDISSRSLRKSALDQLNAIRAKKK